MSEFVGDEWSCWWCYGRTADPGETMRANKMAFEITEVADDV